MKRGHYRHIGKRLTYQRVLLALHWLSHDGLFSEATNAEIGRVAERSPDTVDGYLTAMETEGTIAVFGRRNGLNRRVIVILGHPETETFIRSLGMTNRLSRWDWALSDVKAWNE
jgi:hypothetical protein